MFGQQNGIGGSTESQPTSNRIPNDPGGAPNSGASPFQAPSGWAAWGKNQPDPAVAAGMARRQAMGGMGHGGGHLAAAMQNNSYGYGANTGMGALAQGNFGVRDANRAISQSYHPPQAHQMTPAAHASFQRYDPSLNRGASVAYLPGTSTHTGELTPPNPTSMTPGGAAPGPLPMPPSTTATPSYAGYTPPPPQLNSLVSSYASMLGNAPASPVAPSVPPPTSNPTTPLYQSLQGQAGGLPASTTQMPANLSPNMQGMVDSNSQFVQQYQANQASSRSRLMDALGGIAGLSTWTNPYSGMSQTANLTGG